MQRVWSPTLAWLAAVVVALLLALASPTEWSVMGRLPELQARGLNQQTLVLPDGLGAERTLALISFHRDHRPIVDSWVEGMAQTLNAPVRRLRMVVLNDPGDDAGRRAIEQRLRERYAQAAAEVVPVFTDRSLFARTAGLPSTEQAHAVVLNRRGEVLARVTGRFDPDKARSLRAMLME